MTPKRHVIERFPTVPWLKALFMSITKKRTRRSRNKKAKSSHTHIDQSGLEWTDRDRGGRPIWTKEPDLDAIASVARSVLDPGGSTLAVAFFAAGGFNKLYNVDCKGRSYLLRVTLPVDPFYKALSEVTTILHLQKKTDIPVPCIVAFDASRDNAIGFEWILMEKLPGQQVDKIWHTLS